MENLPGALDTSGGAAGTGSGPAAEPPRAVGEGYLTCDFCECKLTKRGEVYQMSAKSKEYRDANEKHEKTVAQLNEEIARLNGENAEKDREIAALKSSVAPTKVKMM